jgi:hypothetical protein
MTTTSDQGAKTSTYAGFWIDTLSMSSQLKSHLKLACFQKSFSTLAQLRN